MKNRYKDIFPYEHTRVHLHRHTNSMSSLSPTQSLTKVRSNSRSCSNNVFNSESETDDDNDDDNDNVDGGQDNGNNINNDVTMAGNTYIDNYINANYLMLPDVENLEANMKVRYIATQKPMLSTVHDFYTCVINDCVPLIIALTDEFENGIERCFR